MNINKMLNEVKSQLVLIYREFFTSGKKISCFIFTFVILFAFLVCLISCNKKVTTENKDGSEKKEQVKTDLKTAEKKDSIKSTGSIIIFEADNGADPKQIVHLSDCKDLNVNFPKDFAGGYYRCETGYEKETEKIIEDIKDAPDFISIDMNKKKLTVSLTYDLLQDNESIIVAGKFENEGNKFTLTFSKNGKESIITGKIIYSDMKVKGWKENIMKVLLIESGKNKVIYFVGPDWAG
jgi:hypothetical protein